MKKYITTFRLDLGDDEDRQAWEHLQRRDKKTYRSVSKAVVAAVNAYFGRQERLAADPYLETREKEDAFLQEIRETLRSALQATAPVNLGAMLQLAQSVPSSAPPAPDVPAKANDEDMDAALDFADSF